MTRKERALKNLKQMCSEGRYLGSGSYAPLEVLEDFKVAIKALEQETVSKEVYDHEYFLRKEYELKIDKLQHQLDKIRAEIKALSPEPTAYDVVDGNPVKDAIWETLKEVDKIIDKYKAESENT